MLTYATIIPLITINTINLMKSHSSIVEHYPNAFFISPQKNPQDFLNFGPSLRSKSLSTKSSKGLWKFSKMASASSHTSHLAAEWNAAAW